MANEEDSKEAEVPVEVAAPDPAEVQKKLETANAELKDRLLRTAAEFENYKKRAKKEVYDAQLRGREALLKEVLPVLDNLERALSHAQEKDPLAIGVRM